jgi:hypothetical protein
MHDVSRLVKRRFEARGASDRLADHAAASGGCSGAEPGKRLLADRQVDFQDTLNN